MIHFKKEDASDGQILRLTFNTGRGNLLTKTFFEELSGILRDVTTSPVRPRAVLIETDNAEAFSLGFDPAPIASAGVAERIEIFKTLVGAFLDYARCPVPIVCRVSGPVVMAGIGVAAMSQIQVVNAAKFKISLAEHSIGFPWPVEFNSFCGQQIPEQILSVMTMTGMPLTQKHLAQTSYGLYTYEDEVDPSGQETVSSVLKNLLRLDPEATARGLLDSKARIAKDMEGLLETFEARYTAYLGSEHFNGTFRRLMKK